MALKISQICSNLLKVSLKPGAVYTNQYSGKIQVKLFQKKPGAKEFTNLVENKATIVDTLTQLLNISKFTAINLITEQRQLYQVHADVLTNNHKILIEHGITKETIVKYPGLLAAQQSKDLETNLIELKTLPYPLADVIYLATLDSNKLKLLLEKENFLPKVDVLIRKLNTTVDVVMEAFVKRSLLMKIGLQRMEEVIDLLKENNVCTSDILKDWWILQYTPQTINEKLTICKEHNLDPVKTWMVRCTPEILDRYIQRRSDNKLVLGEHTFVEYLSQRLQCTPDFAKSLMLKLPALQNKSMKKLKEIIDFLYAEGFQPYHICRVPKILLHSVDTTKKRIRELERQGVRMDSLHVLTKSQRQYMQYYQALVKSNANKLKLNEGASTDEELVHN